MLRATGSSLHRHFWALARPGLPGISSLNQRTRSNSTVCTVSSLDHLVLTVKDLPKTIEFYEMLGMTHTTFKAATSPEIRHALSFGSQKINLHQSGKEFEPKAGEVTPGSADLAFLTDDAVEQVAQRLKASGIILLEDGTIVQRTGARGILRSCYCRDPDGNLIESVALPYPPF